MVTGLDYPLRRIGGSLAIVKDSDLCEAWIRFVLDSYLPESFKLFQPLPSPLLLAEDLRLALIRYIPEGNFRVDGSLLDSDSASIEIVVNWEYLGDTGIVTTQI